MKNCCFIPLFSFFVILVSLPMQGQNKNNEKHKADTTVITKFIPAADSLSKQRKDQLLLLELEEKSERKGERPYVTVEQMPSFPGGESELMKFIAENLKYPKVDMEEGLCFRSTVRFVVEADGSISDIKAIRGCSKSVDKEIIRVVEMMPKWIPGMQNGKAVPVYFTLPMHWRPR